MDFYKEFHKNLTAKKLEQHIEFVDWTLVPNRLFTAKLKKKFGSIPKIKAAIWFRDILKSFEKIEDDNKYPGKTYFFIKGKCYIEYNKESKTLWCSSERIWSILEKEMSFSYEETECFLRKMIKNNLKIKLFNPQEDHVGYSDIEMHFNSIKNN